MSKIKHATENWTNNNFTNVLKKTKSGCPLILDDISPIEHDILAAEDIGATSMIRTGKNIFNYVDFLEKFPHINGNPNAKYLNQNCFSYKNFHSSLTDMYFPLLASETGTQYTITLEYAFSYQGNETYTQMPCFNVLYTDGTRTPVAAANSYNNKFTKVVLKTDANKTVRGLQIAGFSGDCTIYIKHNMQIELGAVSTDYEPYVEPIEYISDQDPIKIPSLYPTTVLYEAGGGGVVTAEYHRDINKAFAELQNAFLSLGGNI